MGQLAAALDDDPQRLVAARGLGAGRRAEDVLGDPVAHIEGTVARLQVRDGLGDPARLGDETHRERGGQGSGLALRIVGRVGAVLEKLQEVHVAVGLQLEEHRRGLPPRRCGDVEALAAGLIEQHDGDVAQATVGPVGILLRARQHDARIEAVAAIELAGVLDDDPDPAGELDVL